MTVPASQDWMIATLNGENLSLKINDHGCLKGQLFNFSIRFYTN